MAFIALCLYFKFLSNIGTHYQTNILIGESAEIFKKIIFDNHNLAYGQYMAVLSNKYKFCMLFCKLTTYTNFWLNHLFNKTFDHSIYQTFDVIYINSFQNFFHFSKQTTNTVS